LRMRGADRCRNATHALWRDADHGLYVRQPARRLGLVHARRSADGVHGHLAPRQRGVRLVCRCGLSGLGSGSKLATVRIRQAGAVQSEAAGTDRRAGCRIKPLLHMPSPSSETALIRCPTFRAKHSIVCLAATKAVGDSAGLRLLNPLAIAVTGVGARAVGIRGGAAGTDTELSIVEEGRTQSGILFVGTKEDGRRRRMGTSDLSSVVHLR